MPRYSFYDAETGIFIDRRVGCRAELIERNTRPGTVAIEGTYSGSTQRVDVATGEVVPYTPPPPDPNDPQVRFKHAMVAKRRIRKLELEQQRPLRKLAIDPLNLEAKQRLQAIDAELEELLAVPDLELVHNC